MSYKKQEKDESRRERVKRANPCVFLSVCAAPGRVLFHIWFFVHILYVCAYLPLHNSSQFTSQSCQLCVCVLCSVYRAECPDAKNVSIYIALYILSIFLNCIHIHQASANMLQFMCLSVFVVLHTNPPDYDDAKVQQIPAISDIGVLVHDQAVGNNLQKCLYGKNNEEGIFHCFLWIWKKKQMND